MNIYYVSRSSLSLLSSSVLPTILIDAVFTKNSTRTRRQREREKVRRHNGNTHKRTAIKFLEKCVEQNGMIIVMEDLLINNYHRDKSTISISPDFDRSHVLPRGRALFDCEGRRDLSITSSGQTKRNTTNKRASEDPKQKGYRFQSVSHPYRFSSFTECIAALDFWKFLSFLPY